MNVKIVQLQVLVGYCGEWSVGQLVMNSREWSSKATNCEGT